MKLTPRFAIALALLVTTTTAGLGIALREEQRSRETTRFDHEVQTACTRITLEVRRQSEADRKLVNGACQSGELVDRTLVTMESGDLESRKLALSTIVPDEKQALDLDELLLVTSRGEVLGASPRELIAVNKREIDAQLATPADRFLYAQNNKAIFAAHSSLISRCSRSRNGKAVGLVGARHLEPLLNRLGTALGIHVQEGTNGSPDPNHAAASCVLDDGVTRIPIVVTEDKTTLFETLAAIDRTVLFSVAVSIGIALLIAVILARGLGKPISELAREASKVADGNAQPIGEKGSGEIAELARAFDRMLLDLARTRRRLAATTRVAAWREVARRVAHEIKNPLAPIRAAVETLRRLRARNDSAFDEYFDEATRTVLDEVHRISTIVSEFTRFARLPPPKPQDVDVPELLRGVLSLQRAQAGSIDIRLEVDRNVKTARLDRDQIIQVITNLVQNAIDAITEGSGTEIVVRCSVEESLSRLCISIRDDGPGVSSDMLARLFEPYATSKIKGTGLGLAIAQRIAIEHGGELTFVPQTSRGAEFRLLLPIDGPPAVSEMGPPSSR